MNIDDILAEWSKDSNVNINELGQESINIPKLHNKYYRMLSNERLLLLKHQSDYKKLELDKYEYYSGNLDEESLKEKGWKPWPKLILKGDLDRYIEADKDVISLSLKIGLQKEKVTMLESILHTLSNRQYQIRNTLEFMKIQNGM